LPVYLVDVLDIAPLAILEETSTTAITQEIRAIVPDGIPAIAAGGKA